MAQQYDIFGNCEEPTKPKPKIDKQKRNWEIGIERRCGMMAYIDRDKVLNRLSKLSNIATEPPMDNEDEIRWKLLYELQKEFSEIPTADVVEVVRCEKCKYGDVSCHARTIDGKETIACYCNLKNKVTDVDWYCPSGERRDT